MEADARVADALRAAFEREGFDEDGVGAVAQGTAERAGLETLTRLFVFGAAVAADTAAKALAPAELQQLRDAGFVAETVDSNVRARVRATPYAGAVFIHDAGG